MTSWNRPAAYCFQDAIIIDALSFQISKLQQSIAELQAIISSKLHKRRCFTCGWEFYAADSVVPYCLCDNCKSQDTRKVT